MSMPAASRCTTSRPGCSDQMRRPSSLLCLRVNCCVWLVLALVLSAMIVHPVCWFGPRHGLGAIHATLSPTASYRLLWSRCHQSYDRQDQSHTRVRAGSRQCDDGHSLPCLASTILLALTTARRAVGYSCVRPKSPAR